MRVATVAVATVTTVKGQAYDDMVTDIHRPDIGPDLLDYAGGLVTKNDGERVREIALDDVKIGVADTHSDDTDKHFATYRFRDGDILNRQTCPWRTEHGRPHDTDLCVTMSAAATMIRFVPVAFADILSRHG
jgi:hypothetical protein